VKLSEAGRAHLIREEGFRNTMYRDPVGLPTVGVGHLLTRDELSSGKLRLEGWFDWHPGLTDQQVRWLFAQDLAPIERAITGLVRVPLTQGQFDALVSFTFNEGLGAFRGSTLLAKLNAGDYAAVPAELRRWHYAGGEVLPLLERRREVEITLWEGTA